MPPKKKRPLAASLLLKKNIGRRTGKNVLEGKQVRRRADGLENFDDYMSESDADITRDVALTTISEGSDSQDPMKENTISSASQMSNSKMSASQSQICSQSLSTTAILKASQSQLSKIGNRSRFALMRTNSTIGRRTGKDILSNKTIRLNDKGLENFDDYLSESDVSSYSSRLSMSSARRLRSELNDSNQNRIPPSQESQGGPDELLSDGSVERTATDSLDHTEAGNDKTLQLTDLTTQSGYEAKERSNKSINNKEPDIQSQQGLRKNPNKSLPSAETKNTSVAQNSLVGRNNHSHACLEDSFHNSSGDSNEGSDDSYNESLKDKERTQHKTLRNESLKLHARSSGQYVENRKDLANLNNLSSQPDAEGKDCRENKENNKNAKLVKYEPRKSSGQVADMEGRHESGESVSDDDDDDNNDNVDDENSVKTNEQVINDIKTAIESEIPEVQGFDDNHDDDVHDAEYGDDEHEQIDRSKDTRREPSQSHSLNRNENILNRSGKNQENMSNQRTNQRFLDMEVNKSENSSNKSAKRSSKASDRTINGSSLDRSHRTLNGTAKSFDGINSTKRSVSRDGDKSLSRTEKAELSGNQSVSVNKSSKTKSASSTKTMERTSLGRSNRNSLTTVTEMYSSKNAKLLKSEIQAKKSSGNGLEIVEGFDDENEAEVGENDDDDISGDDYVVKNGSDNKTEKNADEIINKGDDDDDDKVPEENTDILGDAVVENQIDREDNQADSEKVTEADDNDIVGGLGEVENVRNYVSDVVCENDDLEKVDADSLADVEDGSMLRAVPSDIDVAGNRSGSITKLEAPASVVSFNRTKKRLSYSVLNASEETVKNRKSRVEQANAELRRTSNSDDFTMTNQNSESSLHTGKVSSLGALTSRQSDSEKNGYSFRDNSPGRPGLAAPSSKGAQDRPGPLDDCDIQTKGKQSNKTEIKRSTNQKRKANVKADNWTRSPSSFGETGLGSKAKEAVSRQSEVDSDFASLSQRLKKSNVPETEITEEYSDDDIMIIEDAGHTLRMNESGRNKRRSKSDSGEVDDKPDKPKKAKQSKSENTKNQRQAKKTGTEVAIRKDAEINSDTHENVKTVTQTGKSTGKGKVKTKGRKRSTVLEIDDIESVYDMERSDEFEKESNASIGGKTANIKREMRKTNEKKLGGTKRKTKSATKKSGITANTGQTNEAIDNCDNYAANSIDSDAVNFSKNTTSNSKIKKRRLTYSSVENVKNDQVVEFEEEATRLSRTEQKTNLKKSRKSTTKSEAAGTGQPKSATRSNKKAASGRKKSIINQSNEIDTAKIQENNADKEQVVTKQNARNSKSPENMSTRKATGAKRFSDVVPSSRNSRNSVKRKAAKAGNKSAKKALSKRTSKLSEDSLVPDSMANPATPINTSEMLFHYSSGVSFRVSRRSGMIEQDLDNGHEPGQGEEIPTEDAAAVHVIMEPVGNMTPCLSRPAGKASRKSKGRRVTICPEENQEHVIDYPADSSHRRRPSTPAQMLINKFRHSLGMSDTPLPSMSSSPVHIHEVTHGDADAPGNDLDTSQIITSRLIYPDPAPEGLRRSNRIRIKPVEWYKNEQVIIDRCRDGGPAIVGVKPSLEAKWKPLEEEKRKRRMLKTQIRKAAKGLRSSNRKHRRLSMHVPMPKIADVVDKASGEVAVLNPFSGESELLDCITKSSDVTQLGPGRSSPKPEDPYLITQFIDQPCMSAGKLTIRPLAEKPTNRNVANCIVFTIEYGVVLVTIHETSSILKTGDMFIVPISNTYSIKNLRSDEADLRYFISKKSGDTITEDEAEPGEHSAQVAHQDDVQL